MPLGTSMGAALMNSELFMTLRYRHAQFDAEAAARFGRLYEETLTKG
jgi:hypothetical protein